MKKAYGYYRVSTEEQAKEGLSIESQINKIRKWADDNKFQILNEFIDEGKSASTMKRPALQEMLSAIKREKIDAIIVVDTDRLARNTLDHLTIKAFLKQNDVTLISINQPMIDDSPEGKLMDMFIASVNEYQSLMTGRKTSNTLIEKASFGWYPALPPLGYTNIVNSNSTCKFDRSIIIQDPKIAPFLKKAFDMYATGDYTLESVTKYLNENNVKPRRGVKLHKNTVNRTLVNKFYTGYFIWGKKEYKGKHEPLISTKVYNKIIKVLKDHNKGVSRSRKHNFLLRGYLHDTENRRFVGVKHIRNRKSYSFYVIHKIGKGTYVDSLAIEKKVERLFCDIQISKEYVDYVLDLTQKMMTEQRSDIANQKRHINNEVNNRRKGMQELEDQRFIYKSITNEQFIPTYERYENEIIAYEDKLASIDKDYSANIRKLEDILHLAEDIGYAYKKAQPEIKRKYLGMFFEKIIIDVSTKDIVGYKLNPEVEELISLGKVLIRTQWGG